MNTQEVLKMAFDCGVLIQVKGDKLHLEAKEAPPNHLLAELKANKNELLTLLAANDHCSKSVLEPVILKTASPPPIYASNELLTHYEKPLFYHLLACPYCYIQKAQYCTKGYAMGSMYDALLLGRDDAQARREDLALRIDRACISGRSVFESFSPANVQHTPNIEPTTSKYGNTPEYEAFINHWTACKVCKPNLGRYCSEGQKLKEVAKA